MVEIIVEDINLIKASSLLLISNKLGIINEGILSLLNCPKLLDISTQIAKIKKPDLGNYYMSFYEENISKIGANSIYYAVVSDMPNGVSSTHNYMSSFNNIFKKIYNDKSDSICVIMYPLNHVGVIKNMLFVHLAQIARSFSDKINIQFFFLNKEEAEAFNQFIF